MLSEKGFVDFKCLLRYILEFKDSAIEIKTVKNDFPGEFSACGNAIFPSNRFEIIFIFREYERLPQYATVRLEYVNGEFGFTHEKYCFDGTELRLTQNSGSMDKEKMNNKFNLLYETVTKDAARILEEYDSVTF